MNEEQKPRVGMGIMILKNGKVLMGKRKTSHGVGEYAFPGGHLEYMESFEDCVRRETREECGVEIKNIKFLHVGNVFHYAPKHYVNLVLLADWESGEPQVLEEDKIEGWQWYELDNLPEPVFIQTGLAIESYKTGQNYYDAVQ
jgi:8-oxo-dGTP diphosphatase